MTDKTEQHNPRVVNAHPDGWRAECPACGFQSMSCELYDAEAIAERHREIQGCERPGTLERIQETLF